LRRHRSLFKAGSKFTELNDASGDAIALRLLDIGEQTKRITSVTRALDQSIPWSLIAKMRDHIAHHYDGINIKTVYETAVQDVPELREKVLKLIKQLTVNPSK
jgi:uncharacterized protein with HEPN domain